MELWIVPLVGLHLTPASSAWTQSCAPMPSWGQELSVCSKPVHKTPSRRIGPVPCTKVARDKASTSVIRMVYYYYSHPWMWDIPFSSGNPSCLHTTLASFLLHASSHTVPHWLLKQNSTRPSAALLPLTSCTSPSAHTVPWNNEGMRILYAYNYDSLAK